MSITKFGIFLGTNADLIARLMMLLLATGFTGFAAEPPVSIVRKLEIKSIAGMRLASANLGTLEWSKEYDVSLELVNTSDGI